MNKLDFIEVQKHVNILNVAYHLSLEITDKQGAEVKTICPFCGYNKNSKVIMHCFSGSLDFAKECVKEGWYLAIGGVVTFKNAIKPKEVAQTIPLSHLVLETDSPYLTPVPYRGKENKPSYVRYVAEEIAKLREVDVDMIVGETTKNAENFFGI